uniref:Uncharacterized protein n=1 Tax=Timema douglasi TaxID=61478 RepID=A0A7R8VGG1_TIMDO|nr:unnamed protein product [Timema douglasi]
MVGAKETRKLHLVEEPNVPTGIGTGQRMSRAGAHPSQHSSPLPHRRYSVPETVMRRYTLTKQRSDSSDSGGVATVPVVTPEAIPSDHSNGSRNIREAGKRHGEGDSEDRRRDSPSSNRQNRHEFFPDKDLVNDKISSLEHSTSKDSDKNERRMRRTSYPQAREGSAAAALQSSSSTKIQEFKLEMPAIMLEGSSSNYCQTKSDHTLSTQDMTVSIISDSAAERNESSLIDGKIISMDDFEHEQLSPSAAEDNLSVTKTFRKESLGAKFEILSSPTLYRTKSDHTISTQDLTLSLTSELTNGDKNRDSEIDNTSNSKITPKRDFGVEIENLKMLSGSSTTLYPNNSDHTLSTQDATLSLISGLTLIDNEALVGESKEDENYDCTCQPVNTSAFGSTPTMDEDFRKVVPRASVGGMSSPTMYPDKSDHTISTQDMTLSLRSESAANQSDQVGDTAKTSSRELNELFHENPSTSENTTFRSNDSRIDTSEIKSNFESSPSFYKTTSDHTISTQDMTLSLRSDSAFTQSELSLANDEIVLSKSSKVIGTLHEGNKDEMPGTDGRLSRRNVLSENKNDPTPVEKNYVLKQDQDEAKEILEQDEQKLEESQVISQRSHGSSKSYEVKKLSLDEPSQSSSSSPDTGGNNSESRSGQSSGYNESPLGRASETSTDVSACTPTECIVTTPESDQAQNMSTSSDRISESCSITPVGNSSGSSRPSTTPEGTEIPIKSLENSTTLGQTVSDHTTSTQDMTLSLRSESAPDHESGKSSELTAFSDLVQDIDHISFMEDQKKEVIKSNVGSIFSALNVKDKPTNVIPNDVTTRSTQTSAQAYNWSHVTDETRCLRTQHQPQHFWANQGSVSENISGEQGPLSSCIGTGSVYRKNVDAELVVPRYSALPRSMSMLVNTSSGDCSSNSNSDSECLSLVDSLEESLSPNHKKRVASDHHCTKVVRADIVDLLPVENNEHKHKLIYMVTPRGRAKAFFVSISGKDDSGKEIPIKPNTISQSMPEKLKKKLSERYHELEVKKIKKQNSKELGESPNDEKKRVISKYQRKTLSRTKTPNNRGVKLSPTLKEKLSNIPDDQDSKVAKRKEKHVIESKFSSSAEQSLKPQDTNHVISHKESIPPPIKEKELGKSIQEENPHGVKTAGEDTNTLNKNFREASTSPMSPKCGLNENIQSAPTRRSANILANRFQRRFEVIPEEKSGSLESSTEDQNRLVAEQSRRASLTVEKIENSVKQDENDINNAFNAIYVDSKTNQIKKSRRKSNGNSINVTNLEFNKTSQSERNINNDTLYQSNNKENSTFNDNKNKEDFYLDEVRKRKSIKTEDNIIRKTKGIKQKSEIQRTSADCDFNHSEQHLLEDESSSSNDKQVNNNSGGRDSRRSSLKRKTLPKRTVYQPKTVESLSRQGLDYVNATTQDKLVQLDQIKDLPPDQYGSTPVEQAKIVPLEISKCYQGRASLMLQAEERDLLSLSRGWINFYLIKENLSTPDESNVEDGSCNTSDKEEHRHELAPLQKTVSVVGGGENRIRQCTVPYRPTQTDDDLTAHSPTIALPELLPATRRQSLVPPADRGPLTLPKTPSTPDSDHSTTYLQISGSPRLGLSNVLEGSGELACSESSVSSSGDSEDDRDGSPAVYPLRWPVRARRSSRPHRTRSRTQNYHQSEATPYQYQQPQQTGGGSSSALFIN